jgi:hypothetical protein
MTPSAFLRRLKQRDWSALVNDALAMTLWWLLVHLILAVANCGLTHDM